MLAFAGNSLLCRLALADGEMDPVSFTVIRIVAAFLTLAAILVVRRGRFGGGGSWRSAFTLFVYAIAFSLAYVVLDAATGALILFGTVQCTMIASGLIGGERPGSGEVAGWLLAASGLVVLLLPGAAAPSAGGSALMAVAGIGWGLYSLYGRKEARPLAATAGNFLRALPLLVPLTGVAFATGSVTTGGVVVASLAGSLTTGMGYILWYAALPTLTALRAALVQLSVPAIAAAGGVLLLGEVPGPQVLVGGGAILGGIAWATRSGAA